MLICAECEHSETEFECIMPGAVFVCVLYVFLNGLGLSSPKAPFFYLDSSQQFECHLLGALFHICGACTSVLQLITWVNLLYLKEEPKVYSDILDKYSSAS